MLIFFLMPGFHAASLKIKILKTEFYSSTKNLKCLFFGAACVSNSYLFPPKLPVMINKSRLHLIICRIPFNVILFYVEPSPLSVLAISFCLTLR